MAALLSLIAFQLTFRVAEPEARARHLRSSANAVNGRGLGEVTSAARNVAGNAVLCDGQSHRVCLDGRPGIHGHTKPPTIYPLDKRSLTILLLR